MKPLENPKLSIEEITRLPSPGFNVPVNLSFSPDDKLIAYLHSPNNDLTRLLYVYDPGSGESRLIFDPPEKGDQEKSFSLQEALIRERQRLRALGVTTYRWLPGENRLLVPLKNNLNLINCAIGDLQLLLEGGSQPVLDPRFSPDGNWISYVQDSELYLIPVAGGKPTQLTFGAKEYQKSHGLAEYIAQEEMGRRRGYWWSTDSRWIAFTEVDETHIPFYRILHHTREFAGDEALEEHRYPFAGQPNARVRLGVIPITGGDPVWMNLGSDEDIYLARVQWLPDGDLCAQRLNREQTRLELIRFNPSNGHPQLLLAEESDTWINLHDMFRPFSKNHPDYGYGFIWASERNGFRHLYLYDANGTLIRPLTHGDWMVEEIAGLDEERELVYLLGTRDSPCQRHLYAVPFNGNNQVCLTSDEGMHHVVLDHKRMRFIDTHHSVNKPPSVSLKSLEDGAHIAHIYQEIDPRIKTLNLLSPQLISLENRDGTGLFGGIFRPPSTFGSGPYPTIVYTYGGPHAQLVTDSWQLAATMRAQYLSQQGFLVFVLDNRGSAGRGLAFEGAIRHRLGHVELQDQLDGVHRLVEQGLADQGRIGIYGTSYGGYMALMALFNAPEIFKVAVSISPVTDWRGYDTCYTERYLGLPQHNAEGYDKSSPLEYVNSVEGKLLLIHGLIDENVHFRHTALLVNALIEANKEYDLLIFPQGRHGFRQPQDRIFLEQRIRDYFIENLY